MKNLLITCNNEKEFNAIMEKFGNPDKWVWEEYDEGHDVVRLDDGIIKDIDSKGHFNSHSIFDDHERLTAEEIINLFKPKKTMSKKTYKTKVEVEKTIKFSLPKYEVGKPITVDFAEERGNDKPVRLTILPYFACWSYMVDENIYKYLNSLRDSAEVSESYINKHLIKA